MSKLYPLLFLVFCSPVLAISVKPMELYGTEEELVSRVIQVTNPSKYDEFVKVNVYQVLEPASPQEQEIKIDNASSLKMSVYPRRFKVGAGETKQVRLLIPENNIQSEQIYRIRFVPVSSFEQGVTVRVSYGVLLRVLPEERTASLVKSTDDSGKIEFKNIGNVRLHVKTSCSLVDNPDFRVYPGASINVIDGCESSDYVFEDDNGKSVFY